MKYSRRKCAQCGKRRVVGVTALGNAVVPAQAAAAFKILFERLSE